LKVSLAGSRDPTSLAGSLKIGIVFFSQAAVFLALGFTVAFFLGTAFTNLTFAFACFPASFSACFLALTCPFISFLIFNYSDLLAFSALFFSFCAAEAAFLASLAAFSASAFSSFTT
jgi:hypothetical protein